MTPDSDTSSSGTDFVVEEITDLSPELASAIAELVPQLSSSAPPPTFAELAEIAGTPTTALFVASDRHGPLLGTLTLVVFRAPTGPRAWIEDVVVDDAARGRGVGAALVHAALQQAKERGARTVDLTSRPSREAANRLYERVGFGRRETNVYRIDLGD